MESLRDRHVVLGVCGSIAAYKAVLLLRRLTAAGARVTPVMTRGARRFVGADTFSALAGRPADGGAAPSDAAAIAHVALAHQADAVVVAPATAHLLAQAAAGLCPDLLTSVLLATRAPQIIAPAMEEGMWEHPATRDNVQRLVARGVHLVAPAQGRLASGHHGAGRMAEPEAIVRRVAAALAAEPGALAGRHVLVTAGPTREPIDPARFLSNRATGRMGLAVARAARRRGARVTLVLGPTPLAPPADVEVVRVESCQEMFEACRAHIGGSDAWVMAAAPADWRAPAPAAHKRDKSDTALEVVPTVDILTQLPRPQRTVTVGFAAETRDFVARGAKKLARKRLDLLFVNDVGRTDRGFAADTNAGWLLRPGAEAEAVALQSKAALGDLIVERVVALLADAA